MKAWSSAAILLGTTAAVSAAPPLEALPAPTFSFDFRSPTVIDGGITPDGILMLDLPDLETMMPGWMFGLGLSPDELDAQSASGSEVAAGTSYALLFSVDTATVGVAAPDPDLLAADVPYNATDQANRGQAAGDQFMSTALFVRAGGRIRSADGDTVVLTNNNVLVRNNFDEGGTDFAAEPPTSARDFVEDQAQDQVDATAAVVSASESVYFSAGAESPSLYLLCGSEGPSGSTIFTRSSEAQRYPRGGGHPQPGPDPVCRMLCYNSAQDALMDCLAGGGHPADCELVESQTLWSCFETECNQPPPQIPCEEVCWWAREEAYFGCLDVGGPPGNCAAFAEQIATDCLANECPNVLDPFCDTQCDRDAEQALNNCLDQGREPDDCVNEAHGQFVDCLITECGYDSPRPSSVYASFLDLGLRREDDIDALIVFDAESDGLFNGMDEVLFSLAPGSPSLATIPGASAVGAAADVFVARPGRAPAVHAPASVLGLGHPNDNIDALDYTLCDDAAACAIVHGIRAVAADFNDDGNVDAQDFATFEDCLNEADPELSSTCVPVDLDVDGDVDCEDWNRFTDAWTGTTAPPVIPRCAKAIPALSGWGICLMTLLLMVAGGIVVPRYRRGRSAT